ncbi:hypothetical protein SAMN04488020_106133 [Palleronia marisminoris]|uniref:Uncharacterized protein n=1 Tax=Palleronia marisminoris TaxID=315423 RepID=A0A1Y5T3R3_9RHOB|nr:hypothetical protein [Palleronia marisminoris]SFH07032.1 hypothetical protein SAMN04488020_106133 [Palleronia marisminoris]SLN51641.1 hypothetical protein PAM7066_02366 [Palleronia marisminoris]
MLSLLTQTILADTMRIATRTEARHHPRPAEPDEPRARRRIAARTESDRLPD